MGTALNKEDTCDQDVSYHGIWIYYLVWDGAQLKYIYTLSKNTD